ncbi:MAG: Tol-Pal system beta propeller repeat protein TolB [Nitrospiria bacterium]
MKRVLPIVLVYVFVNGTLLNAAEVFMEMHRSGFRKIPVMIMPFHSDPEYKEESSIIENVLRSDLKRSHVFELIETTDIGLSIESNEKPDSVVMTKASKAGVLALVWAKLDTQENGWVLESQAFETAKGDQVVNVRIFGGKMKLRHLAHRFSDKLTMHFTGEKGVAQSRVAYISDLSGNKEVYIMDYDGANKVRYTRDRSIAISPRWSPDANKISYTSYRNGNPNLYVLDLKTGGRQEIASFPGLNFSASWAPSGEQLAFAATKDGNAEIYLVNADGTGLKRLTFDSADDLSPSWSPSGKQIAFTSDRGGGPQIYIMDVDGANVHRLTFDGNYNTSPAWSPAGDWIAYACRNEERRLKICADRADGTQSIAITESGHWDDESPSWAQNGRELIFSSNRFGKSQIFSIHLDGTHIRRLTSNPANNTSPSWSLP